MAASDGPKRRASQAAGVVKKPAESKDVAPSEASKLQREMPRSLLIICGLTVAIAIAATVTAVAFPNAPATIWRDNLAKQYELMNTKAGNKRVASQVASGKPQVEGLESYPHDPQAFTQGLLVARQDDEKFFIESTGLNGQSSLRKVDIKTGEVLIQYDIDSKFFGEGVTLDNEGNLVMLTWKSKQGFTFELPNGASEFKLKSQFEFNTVTKEGWGIDNDGQHFIVSDGSSTIMFWDPVTKTEVRQIKVTFNGQEVPHLNELEFANGFIYANIWYQPVIVKINPATGEIVAVFDCTELMKQSGASSDPNAVLNGIAYDGDEDVFFVTGKLWKKMFKVRFVG